jgi:hypothetical protein
LYHNKNHAGFDLVVLFFLLLHSSFHTSCFAFTSKPNPLHDHYRHQWIIEADIVDPPAGQMDPSVLDAVQYNGNGHHEIQRVIDRV